MHIKPDVSLAPYTTFQIGGPARLFCSVSNEAELIEAVTFAQHNELPIFVLGKGSNLLVSDAGFPGLVIKNEIRGIEIEETGRVSAGAGENWDDLVDETVAHGLYGLENLSAIPGTVGAAPVQNIGAYGAEVSDVLDKVRALDTSSMKFVEIGNAECRFAYRDSIFKHQKSRYIITKVFFTLKKDGAVNISYRDLREHFADRLAASPSDLPTLAEVREAVISIRLRKLPDWKEWGTAGSFFKNPVVSAAAFAELEKKYPGLPGFPEPDGRIKIPLGWIIDHVCHMKGFVHGHAFTYEKQALVIVTKPGGSASEVVALAHELMACIKEKTGIEIEGEVEWVC